MNVLKILLYTGIEHRSFVPVQILIDFNHMACLLFLRKFYFFQKSGGHLKIDYVSKFTQGSLCTPGRKDFLIAIILSELKLDVWLLKSILSVSGFNRITES